MTPEEITAIIEAHKYPTLHAGDTGINVITLQIWLQMLGFYQGSITGLLDGSTTQAIDAFRAQQRAAGIALQAPTGAVLERDTWVAMDSLLQQRLPPDPTTLERLPFPRRSSYDSGAKYRKALYEGLRVFGFPVQPAQEPLRLPLVINERGVAILHGMPPGAYTLELGDTGSPDRGSAELYLEDGDGAPVSGQIRLVRDGAERSATVASGYVLVNDLQPGDYQVVMERVDDADQIITNTGSVEIRVINADHQPVSGTATLVGETGDVSSLQQAVRLFQALSRKITSGLEPGDKTRLGNILNGEFAETAHHNHALTWDSFEQTWGRFYGAPWMGVVFHPLERGESGDAKEELNWGEYDTITKLLEWGNAYLQASQDEDDLEDRLRRPVAVRYIARSLGGRVDSRSDFSQTGTQASIHLPHKPESVIKDVAAGQTYGSIDYNSADYSSAHLEVQVSCFASMDTNFRTQCPDDNLVNRLLPSELQLLERRLINDQYIRNRSINLSIEDIKTFWKTDGAAFSSGAKTEKVEIFVLLQRSHLSFTSDQLDWVWLADTKFYDTNVIELIIQDPKFEGRVSNERYKYLFALGYIKWIQKALWWCRFLLRADRLSEVKELSDWFVARGYKGLFSDYAKVLDQDTFDKKLTELAFDENDWKNPWQLEALVELYINFNDPWHPPKVTQSGEQRIIKYTKGKNQPRLPISGDEDFRKEAGKEMSKGLHFVLVDPIGPRLSGTDVLAVGTGTDFQLIGASLEEFTKVNGLLDTIRFPDAIGRKTYRIMKRYLNNDSKGNSGHFVKLDAQVGQDGNVIRGSWQIPAGVGGQRLGNYIPNGIHENGSDHCDGVLFVIKDGLIRGRFSINSYAIYFLEERSIRGNQFYNFLSCPSNETAPVGNTSINYAFSITPQANNTRNYFDRTVTSSSDQGVFLHYGKPEGASSDGCLESPQFYWLRNLVLRLYPIIDELNGNWKNQRGSNATRIWSDVNKKLYNPETLLKDSNSSDGAHLDSPEHRLTQNATHMRNVNLRQINAVPDWHNAIRGILWVIRPGERPAI